LKIDPLHENILDVNDFEQAFMVRLSGCSVPFQRMGVLAKAAIEFFV
jgi:hypothetical protein